jgi:putative restriction endonuclease
MPSSERSALHDALLDAFRSIRVYQHPKDGKRAAHKPLLLLLALGYVQRERRHLLPFAEIEPKLISLLKEFGPHRATYAASYPFWYLQNDNDGHLWVVEHGSTLPPRTGKRAEPPASVFREQKIRAGFTPEVFNALVSDPALLRDAARELLERHFPETLHEDIADAVGLTLDIASLGKGVRDPRFRAHVLNAYAHRCAICGFDARLGGKNVGLEAAHIRWVQVRGSNEVDNGMAMCSLHHKLFDAGALTIELRGKLYHVVFSADFNGASEAVRKWILRSHDAQLDLLPLNPSQYPHPDNLRWHNREVFKYPPLSLGA